MRKAGRAYLKKIKSIFPVFEKNGKRFVADLKNSVKLYEIQHADCTIEDLIQQFGEPKQVVDDYFKNFGIEQYVLFAKMALYIKVLVIVVIVGLLIIGAINLIFLEVIWEEAIRSLPAYEEVIIHSY